MTTPTTPDADGLLPLPKTVRVDLFGYTADQMRAYACACIAAQQERMDLLSEEVAALRNVCQPFSSDPKFAKAWAYHMAPIENAKLIDEESK